MRIAALDFTYLDSGNSDSHLDGNSRKRKNERGFSLILMACVVTVTIGMLGLAFDLGRSFIVKTELQTFVDASAIAAAQQLDGTLVGVQTANAIATAGPLGTTRPNGVNFDTVAISSVITGYGTTFNGTYDNFATASSNATNTYRFFKVTATFSHPVYFLPIVGVPSSQAITASAIAGQQAHSSIGNGGLIPFSPDAHNAANTKNFGFTPGVQYTLKWGNGNSTTCAGDQGFNPGNAASAHGFVNLGQGNGNSSLTGLIVFGGYPNSNSNPSSVSAGSTLSGVPGNRGASIFSAAAERSAQDPDQTSTTWAAYRAAGTGNGRRIVTAAINDPSLAAGNGANRTVRVIGFGNFLLDPSNTISGNSGALCATYIGPGNLTGTSSGGSDGTQVYSTLLYQ